MKLRFLDEHTLVSSRRRIWGASFWLVVTLALATAATLGFLGRLPEVGRWGAAAVAVLALGSAFAAMFAYEHLRITVDTFNRWVKVLDVSNGCGLQVSSDLKNVTGVRVREFRDAKDRPEFQVFLVRDRTPLAITGYGGPELVEVGKKVHAWLTARGVNADFTGPEAPLA